MNLDFDRQHIWHPYTSITHPAPVFPVAGAKGVILTLEDGRQLIDGMSSWWCMLHGYNHPVLNQAIIDQTQKMAHVMFGGLTHEPAISLAEKIIRLTPKPLKNLFFCDSGSIAVEVAMKMALQYWQAQGQPQKQKIMSFRKGYHGDTFAAMSVCDPQTGMHHLFADVILQQIFAESPQCGFHDQWDENTLTDVKQKLNEHHHELAAVIIEPIVQATGGMNFYSPHFLRRLRELCTEYEVLLIVDEIATNFGRTGELFGCNHAGISPDIMCLGKALTGGYMTMAATICTQKVGSIACSGEAGVLMHGPTFMANPLACAVAGTSIDLLINSPWQQNIKAIESQLIDELSECIEWPQVADVRILGGIGVIELKQAIDLKRYQEKFVEQGVWVRPFGKLVYVMPPFIIEPEQLSMLTKGMKNVIRSIA
ncbi:MAG: adenosylmethionine-8-amino-7-oxononanoate aminotransferase [Cellvibrionaceae bacterium]|jgi:adenosylmethionine-8-amino-7-oxononanoate aminotransferase